MTTRYLTNKEISLNKESSGERGTLYYVVMRGRHILVLHRGIGESRLSKNEAFLKENEEKRKKYEFRILTKPRVYLSVPQVIFHCRRGDDQMVSRISTKKNKPLKVIPKWLRSKI